MALLFVCEQLKEDEPRLIRTRHYNIGIGELSIMAGAPIGMGALINKNTFEGGALIRKAGAYLKEGAKSNHYGILFLSQFTKKISQDRTFSRGKARVKWE